MQPVVSGTGRVRAPGRLLATTALALVLAAAAERAFGAEPGAGEPVELPPLAVEGTMGAAPPLSDGYQPVRASSHKFTEPLVDTPKTITVITPELMRDQAVTSLKDALRTQPGITLGVGEGGNAYGDRMFIRGFDARNDVFIDGMRDPGVVFRESFDVEQIEILKGPSSAYAGRGSTGGSINIVSKTPRDEDFYAGAVSFGSDAAKRVTADVNHVIDDGIALRMNVMWHDAEVAGRDEVFQRRWGFAPALVVGLGKPTTVTLSYYHLSTDDMPDYGVPFDPRTQRPLAGVESRFYGILDRDFQRTTADIFTAKLEHQFSDRLTFRSQARYGYTTNDYVVSAPERPDVVAGTVLANAKTRGADNSTLANQTDLTWEFETGGLAHTLVAGFEVSRDRVRNRGYAVTPTGVPQNLYDPNPDQPWTGTIEPSPNFTDITAVDAAAFVFDTVKLGPQWELLGGLRFDSWRAEASTSDPATNGLSNESDFLNWQAGVVYKPLPNGSIYASYGSSSDPSGSQLDAATSTEGGLASTTASVDPERTIAYELGTKWNLFGERLTVSGALFRTEKTNMRVPNPGGSTLTQVLEGEARVDGFEIDFAGSITDDWRVYGGFTQLYTKVLKSSNPADEGKRLANIADTSFSLWTTYRVARDLTLGGGAYYVGPFHGGSVAATSAEVPGHWRFDAMASYQVNPNVAVQLNVFNLTDERYYDAIYRSASPFAYVAPGRSALVTTSFRF